jgi:hypothetical protein
MNRGGVSARELASIVNRDDAVVSERSAARVADTRGTRRPSSESPDSPSEECREPEDAREDHHPRHQRDRSAAAKAGWLREVIVEAAGVEGAGRDTP